MPKNVYIHIPFCRQKCHYCSFVSFARIDLKKLYLSALKREIHANYKRESLNTLYFGGGTPSLLTVKEFNELIQLFSISDKTEITAELNPETLNYEYFSGLKKIGINRLSIGCQTFNDSTLRQIGRKHCAKDVENAVKNAQRAGFDNISLDFIYGLPDQTPEMFTSDLEKAVNLWVQHISLYGLKIDEGCYFYNKLPANLPDDEIQSQMYLSAIEILTSNGFEHYEISNFSLPNYNSNHNLNYWNNNTYYGFGAAAHGYENNTRYSNSASIDQYIKNPCIHCEETILCKQEQLEEEIFLGLRKICGINKKSINKKFNIDFDNKYKDILNKYIKTGHLKETDNGYALSDKGILVSNIILSEFID